MFLDEKSESDEVFVPGFASALTVVVQSLSKKKTMKDPLRRSQDRTAKRDRVALCPCYLCRGSIVVSDEV